MQFDDFEKLRRELDSYITGAVKVTEKLMAEVYGTTKEREYEEILLRPERKLLAEIIKMRYPRKAIAQRRERIRDDFYRCW